MKQLLFILIFSFTFLAQAQDKGTIGGKILDSEVYNEPLLMANVALKGTSWSTQTNFNGNFELTDIPTGAYTLLVDFLGYERLEILIKITEGERLDILQSLKAKSLQIPSDIATSEKEDVVLAISKESIFKK